MLPDCRATPQVIPGDPPQRASHSDAGRVRPIKQDQTEHKAPDISKTADASVTDAKPDRHHRRRSQDSRQVSDDRQQSEAGSEQEGEPLVLYQDEEQQPQYSNGYEGGEPEGQDYDMEGGAEQEQQYGNEDGGQQQYGSGDEEQPEEYAEEEVQYGEGAEAEDAPGSGQEDAPDEWDVPVEGDSLSLLVVPVRLLIECLQLHLHQQVQLDLNCHSLHVCQDSCAGPVHSLDSRMVPPVSYNKTAP